MATLVTSLESSTIFTEFSIVPFLSHVPSEMFLLRKIMEINRKLIHRHRFVSSTVRRKEKKSFFFYGQVDLQESFAYEPKRNCYLFSFKNGLCMNLLFGRNHLADNWVLFRSCYAWANPKCYLLPVLRNRWHSWNFAKGSSSFSHLLPNKDKSSNILFIRSLSQNHSSP